jgi:uncharacterized membrane protein
MAEKEAQHRHEIEKGFLDLHGRSLGEDSNLRRRGQWCAVTIALLGILSATWIILHNPTWPSGMAASVIGGGPLVALVLAFLGQKSENGESGEEDKTQANDK